MTDTNKRMTDMDLDGILYTLETSDNTYAHGMAIQAIKQLRTDLAIAEKQRDAAVSGLERISRGDVVFERTGNMLQDVTRAMTAACGLARDTLAHIRELGEKGGE